MEHPYTLAMKELAERREKNRMETERRRAEVRVKEPSLAEIETELMKQGTRLLKCVLDKNADFESVKKRIQSLQAEKAELLRRLNLPADWLNEVVDCSVCRDTGFDEEGHRCACLKQIMMKYVGENANMSEMMRGQTFEKFDFSLFAAQEELGGVSPLKVMQKACATAMDFAEKFEVTSENLLIMGGAGAGKTFLCSCIANRALERGKTVYYQTAYKLFTLLEKIRFGKDAGEELNQISEYIYRADLLIIDDLGTEFVSQFTAAALFDLLNSRLTDGKSTVVSTNLSFEDIERMYAQRTVSRLLGEYRTLNIVGRDLRLSRFRER